MMFESGDSLEQFEKRDVVVLMFDLPENLTSANVLAKSLLSKTRICPHYCAVVNAKSIVQSLLYEWLSMQFFTGYEINLSSTYF